MSPIESTYATSYSFVLSCPADSEMLKLLYAESHCFHAPSLFRSKFQGVHCSLWSRSVLMMYAESEYSTESRAIRPTFKEFQPMFIHRMWTVLCTMYYCGSVSDNLSPNWFEL